jgi:two-component system response regulator GlrR
MSLSVQAKLLRVLQEKKFYPLGSEKPVDVDVRVIVATNKDLEAEVKNGSFREDLFYRIHVVPIGLPPLRERKEEIPPLAEHFLREISQRMKKEIKGISAMAMQKLMLYDWPGNVRELENEMWRLTASIAKDTVTAEDISEAIRSAGTNHSSSRSRPDQSLKDTVTELEKRMIVEALQRCGKNQLQAAQALGLSRQGLIKKMKRYGIRISTK